MKEAEPSERFVRSLDRSVLGSFAVPEDLLILTDIVYRNNGNVSSTVTSGIDSALRREGKSGNREAAGEMFYWWAERDYHRADADPIPALLNDHILLLRKVANAPREFLPFYEAGIWDRATIQNFLDHDIDSELASAVL